MHHFEFKSLLLMTLGSLALTGPVYAADVYPADLARQEPQVASAFADLTKPLARKHSWIKNFGVTTPVVEMTLTNENYVQLSGCKPHNCPSEKYAVLVSKRNNHAVGAFLTNRPAATGDLSDSKIQWLGQPTQAQMAQLATALFPAPDLPAPGH